MNSFLRFPHLIIFIFITQLSSFALESSSNSNSKNFGNETPVETIAPADPITATITGKTSVCLNATQPVITFTGKGGAAPYTFVYQINTGAEITTNPTDVGKDNITVNAPTNINGTFIYTLKKVKDATSGWQDVTGTLTITVNPLPNASFTFTNNNTCSGTRIEFTSSPIGSYTYAWAFGDSSNSSEQNPSHIFKAIGTGTQTFNVKLTITDKTTSCKDSITKIVTVKQGPDAALDLNMKNGATYYDSVQKMFINCKATITTPQCNFVAVNASTTSSTNTSYNIDWGDGGLSENLSASFTKTTHLYNSLGFFDIKVTSINSNNECSSTTTTYRFFNGNSPGGNLGSIGNVDDCAPYTLKWPVENTRTNPKGTTYEFSVNDGSTSQKFDQSTLPDSISHTFTKSSCGLVDNKFTISFISINPCSKRTTTLQVLATEKPKASFNISSNLCLNNIVKFTNTSSGSYEIAGSCKTNFEQIWSISPNTGWTGNLTNTNSIDIKFNLTGEYSIKLKIKIPDSFNSRCTTDSIARIIQINPLPTATILGGANVCQNSTPPTITFTGANGIAPYTFTYKINNGGPQAVKTNSGNSVTIPASTGTAGTFTYTLVSVQEGSPSACSQPQTGTAIIIITPTPTATITGTKSACLNDSSPLITFTGANGTAPYTFTFNIGGGASQTIKTSTGSSVTLAAPTNTVGQLKYNLIGVQDASVNTCAQTQTGLATITINQPPEPMTLINQEYCSGVTTPMIIFSNTVAGTTYSWINSNTSIGLSSTGTGNIPAFMAKNNTASSITSTITVTPSANGCKGLGQTFTITVNPSAAVTFSQPNQTICSGESTANVALSSTTTGAVFSWSAIQPIGITGVETNGTNTIPVQTLKNTTDAPIMVTFLAKATVSGATTCAGIEYPYSITVNPKPIISGSIKDTICSGTSFSTSPKNGGGNIISTGTKYKWSAPVINPTGTLTGGSEQTTPLSGISQTLVNTTSDIATATYSITPITNGCAGTPFDLIIFVNPKAVVDPIKNITLCNNEQNSEIIFGGNPAGAIFNWASTNEDIGMSSTSGSGKIPAFKATNPTTSPISVTITVTSVNGSGNLGCAGTQEKFTMTVNPTGQVNNPGNQNVCNGQNTSIKFTTQNIGGTTTYVWTNSNTNLGLNTSGSGNISFTPKNTGNTVLTATITVTPTFTNNGISCVGTSEQFTISVNPTPTIDQTLDQIVCNSNQTSEIKFSGNIANAIYNWGVTNNAVIGLNASGTGDISPFAAINNSSNPVVANITVTPNINGCIGTPKSFKITVNPSPNLTKQPESSTICLGEKPTSLSVSYTNGVGIPTYQWYSNVANSTIGSSLILNETNTSYNPPYSQAGAIYYYCVITFPTGGCNTLTSDIAKVTINQKPAISTINKEISSGETFTVIPNSLNGDIVPNGTTYTWLEPVISPANSISGSSAQSTPQTLISQTLINNTNSIATVTYTVTPTSGVCIGATFLVIVKVNPPLFPNATINSVTCFGTHNGSIVTNIKGGVPFTIGTPYTVLWTGPNGFTSSSSNISNLYPGVYNLDITDSMGMKFSTNYTITEPKGIIVITDTKKDITCFGADNGEIAISTSGGIGIYKYIWTKNNSVFASAEDISNLGPGIYEVKVTDANNCDPKILTYTISEPSAIAISLQNKTDIKCFGESTGAVSINVKGGVIIEVAPGIFDYKYTWTGPGGFTSSNKDLNNIPAGKYNLTVNDYFDCNQVFSVIITEPTQLLVTANTTPISCYGANNASIQLLISGGVSPYQTQWDNFASGTFQDNLSAGDYSITVADANNCKKTIKVNIPEASIFKVTPVVKNVTCFGANDGSIALNYEGKNESVSFSWSDNSATGTTRNNIGPGTYTVNINGGNLCLINRTFVIVEPLPLVLKDSITNAFDCTIVNGGAISLLTTGGTPPYRYAWSNGATTKDLSKLTAGNYVITVTDSIGCIQTAQYVVKRPLPIKIEVTTKINNCDTKITKEVCTAKVTGGVPPYQLNWSDGKVSGIYNEIMETDQSGLIVLTVTDAIGCSQSQTFITSIPELGITETLLNCDQPIYQFDAIVVDKLEKYTYSWDLGDGTISTDKSPQYTYQTSGSYKVRLTVKNAASCVSEYEQTILALFFDPKSYSIISDETEVTKAQSIVHFGTKKDPDSEYTWDFGDGSPIKKGNGLSDITHEYNIIKDDFFDIILTVTNRNQCEAKDTIRIEVNASVPNTFTPNGDGINDIYMKGWKIKIYNRNGILLYDGEDGWDGNYNGNPVANDTYFVVLYDSSKLGVKYKTNFVTVLR